MYRSTPASGDKQYKLGAKNHAIVGAQEPRRGFAAYSVLMYQTPGKVGLNAPRFSPAQCPAQHKSAHAFTLTISILHLIEPHVKRICQSGEICDAFLSKTYRNGRAFLPVRCEYESFYSSSSARSALCASMILLEMACGTSS